MKNFKKHQLMPIIFWPARAIKRSFAAQRGPEKLLNFAKCSAPDILEKTLHLSVFLPKIQFFSENWLPRFQWKSEKIISENLQKPAGSSEMLLNLNPNEHGKPPKSLILKNQVIFQAILELTRWKNKIFTWKFFKKFQLVKNRQLSRRFSRFFRFSLKKWKILCVSRTLKNPNLKTSTAKAELKFFKNRRATQF